MDERYFFSNMKNSDTQRKFLSETLPSLEALHVALIDEKGITKYTKMTNTLKSDGSSVNKPFNDFKVKKEPDSNFERSYTCIKCGGTFSKGPLAVQKTQLVHYVSTEEILPDFVNPAVKCKYSR